MSTFEKHYWEKNYADPMSMDGIVNAREHAKYLSTLFAIENVEVSSLVDLGFGYGYLFREMLKTFRPKTAVGIEPSHHIFEGLSLAKFKSSHTKVNLYQENLVTWAKTPRPKQKFDLGVCTSVFQYIPTRELRQVLPILAKRIKYLYLTVPTDIELKRQIKEFKFKDEYAIHRSREEYQKLIRPYFTFIGSRLLESKTHFDEKNSSFTDLLFRF